MRQQDGIAVTAVQVLKLKELCSTAYACPTGYVLSNIVELIRAPDRSEIVRVDARRHTFKLFQGNCDGLIYSLEHDSAS